MAQSCLTLCEPVDSAYGLLCPWDSPGKNAGIGCHSLLQGIFPTQGSNPGLLHGRQILYRLSYQRSPKKAVKVKLLSHVRPLATPWTGAYQASLSMGFPRQEYWDGLPFPSPRDLPDPGIEPGVPHCRQTLYRLSHQGSPEKAERVSKPSITSCEQFLPPPHNC